MSKEVLGVLAVVGVGGFIALILWVRLTAKWRDRRSLRRACEALGGNLLRKTAVDVGLIAELPFQDRSFTATVVFTPIMHAWISSSTVECDIGDCSLPNFSVSASSNVGSLGQLSKNHRFKNLLLKTETREEREVMRSLWPDSTIEKMARIFDPRQIREGWLRALDGAVKCDGSKIIFSRSPAFRRPESYRLAVEMLGELLDAAKSSSNPTDAAAGSGQ